MTQILMGFGLFLNLCPGNARFFLGLFFINRETFMNLIKGFTDEKTQIMFE